MEPSPSSNSTSTRGGGQSQPAQPLSLEQMTHHHQVHPQSPHSSPQIHGAAHVGGGGEEGVLTVEISGFLS
jgi:hypothetical protein